MEVPVHPDGTLELPELDPRRRRLTQDLLLAHGPLSRGQPAHLRSVARYHRLSRQGPVAAHGQAPLRPGSSARHPDQEVSGGQDPRCLR